MKDPMEIVAEESARLMEGDPSYAEHAVFNGIMGMCRFEKARGRAVSVQDVARTLGEIKDHAERLALRIRIRMVDLMEKEGTQP